MALKTRLPKNFETLLQAGDLAELKAVFETCDLNARGGYSEGAALAFVDCPDELARWLVAEGADLSAADTHGNTPLHARSRAWRGRIEVLLELGANVHDDGPAVGTPLHVAAASHIPPNARLLLQHGARVDARNRAGLTPLELALHQCSNAVLERMVPLAEELLAAGAGRTEPMKGFVTEIGKRFEFHRGNFNPESVDAASAALDRLYELFDVAPVPRRSLHDGKSMIVVKAARWQDQHQELWDLLVPGSGPATTVQGEVVRIAGRIWHEVDDNGGANWDGDFGRMADAYLHHVQTGTPLPDHEIREVAAIVAQVKANFGNPARLAELAVAWVLANPKPVELMPPAYRR